MRPESYKLHSGDRYCANCKHVYWSNVGGEYLCCRGDEVDYGKTGNLRINGKDITRLGWTKYSEMSAHRVVNGSDVCDEFEHQSE